MPPLLIRNIHTLVTMTDGEKPLHNVDLLVEDGKVAAIGKNLPTPLSPPMEGKKRGVPSSEGTPASGSPPPEGLGVGPRVIDGSNHVVYPGFVNMHHHLYQTLTRNVPKVNNAKLFDWLIGLYEVWRELTPAAIEVSTRVGIGELLLSGCTTTVDHFYLFPSTAPEEWLDIEVDIAREIGMRFHPTRGSMSRGKSAGGLPPDDVVQNYEVILKDCERIVKKYHDPKPFSMCRVILAPCSPFSVTTELLAETSKLARSLGVQLHTHLCEAKDEEAYCLATYGMRPLAYMEKTGWVGNDVWYAHGIYFNEEEIGRIAETGTGIAHCPASNLRLGSGICGVPHLLDRGVKVGLAVDGSASNDASSMVREMQLALLIHRVGTAVDAMPPERVLHLATRGGAAILGRDEIGRLAVGSAADIAMFRLDRIDFAGAMHAPASAILFCGSGIRADYTIVAGEVLVEGEKLVHMNEQELFHRANEIAEKMISDAEKKLGVSYR
ncbi:MAG: 8-oxoguanine deaminase [Kiritimatiellae bacterium]|nr:8-oxoguanine deaminase [Kiritimatiellia bacterium]